MIAHSSKNAGWLGSLGFPSLATAVCVYDAANLAGAAGSTVSLWSNTGSGGSLFDLSAVVGGNGPATLQVSDGSSGNLPAGAKYVRCPPGTYFATTKQGSNATAQGPLSADTSRFIQLVCRLSGTANHNLVCMGVNDSQKGGGTYLLGGNYKEWNHGQDVNIRPAQAATWVVNFWRGQRRTGANNDYLVYTGTKTANLSEPVPNTTAAAPLYLATGFFFDNLNTLDVSLLRIGATFPTDANVTTLEQEMGSRYGLSMASSLAY